MKTLLLLTVLLFSNLCFTQETQRIQYSTYIGGNSEDYSINIQLAANDDIIATLQATAGCVTTPGAVSYTHLTKHICSNLKTG